MKNKINYSTLLNFSKGKYSYNDYLKVKDWFSEIDVNKKERELLFSQWKELINETESNSSSLNHIFEKVQYTILLEEKKSFKKRVIWNFYKQAAAILIVPVLAFLLWYYMFPLSPQLVSQTQTLDQSWIEINAPDGARVKFSLPDSSTGWLNSGAKLKYSALFYQHRKVELTGEAYFEIKHLEHSDFTVSVADMDVKVLGTKFNVSAYSNDNFTSVVLKEGKVEINGKNVRFNHTVLPDEKVTFFNDSKSLKSAHVDANRYIGWKDGYLIIENEPLGQAISRIERWYNVEIFIQNEELKDYRFKATFKDEPLDEVLRLIAKSTPVKYNIQNREVDSSGIFKQKKITIMSR
jgi:ferric-dicitrate binding protein FerR (iron transport regulator)